MCPLYTEHLGQNVFQELNELLYPDFVPDLALAVRGQNKGRRGGGGGGEEETRSGKIRIETSADAKAPRACLHSIIYKQSSDLQVYVFRSRCQKHTKEVL